jgi:hypothetical protein
MSPSQIERNDRLQSGMKKSLKSYDTNNFSSWNFMTLVENYLYLNLTCMKRMFFTLRVLVKHLIHTKSKTIYLQRDHDNS